MTKSLTLSASTSTSETHWTRGAWLTLFAALFFISLNIAQVVYRFTLPSLGWAGPDPDTGELIQGLQLEFNAVGAPSPLQTNDLVLSVNRLKIDKIVNRISAGVQAPEGWQVGGHVLLTVLRDGQEMVFEVPVVHWTLQAWLRTNFGNLSALWAWLNTLLLFGLGAFTFFKRPGNLAARFLFAFGIAFLSGTLGDSVHGYLATYLNTTAALGKVFFSNIIFAYLLGPSFLGFTLTFPRPKKVIQRQSLWLLVPYLVGSITILLLLIAPPLAVIGFLLTFLMLLIGVLALVHTGFTMRDAISRAQLRWAVVGVGIGTAIFMLNFATFQPAFREIILGLANLGFPIVGFSLAIAILRYRLFDIDLLIRRTLLYTILTGLLALVYFGSVVVLQSFFENISGEQSPIVVVVSTLVIAALFNPLRNRVQVFIDRRFYRQKYNAEQALAQFAAAARDEVDMDKLTAALLGVVKETMQPEGVSLWLQREK